MSVSGILLGAGMVTAGLPVLAAFMRGRSRFLQVAVVASAISNAAFLWVVHRWTRGGDETAVGPWAFALVASAVPVLLSGFLLSSAVGRERPDESFRYQRRGFALLGLAGLGFLSMVKLPSFVLTVGSVGDLEFLRLGPLGKAYLSYLLVGIVCIGYNLESTYRVAPAALRPRLRLPFLGLFALLGYLTYVLTTGILYGTLDSQKLLAAAGPFALSHLLVAYGIVRGALTDRGAPVSRTVVYSSFTAMAAGLYVLAIGAVAQISSLTHWSSDQVVTLSLLFLAALIAVLLLVSNRFQRRVRRFIDRNFYVNRYDYRAQWSRVTEILDQARGKEGVLRATRDLLIEVFLADEITIAVRDDSDGAIRPHLGKGYGTASAALPDGTPLRQLLAQERRALLLDRRPDDFEYIRIYAENGEWLKSTASQMVAPLFFAGELVGLLGVDRSHQDDPFGFEDLALLDSIAGHVGSALRAAELSEALADAREMELMSQWSNMLLHDLKNYLTPLRMIAQNLELHRHKPNIAEVAATDLERVADRMDSLVRTLSELRESGNLSRRSVDLNALVRSTIENLQLHRRDSLEVAVNLRATSGVWGDRGLLGRVLENLIQNAVEAMEGRGTLTLTTEELAGPTGTGILLSVSDTGPGMSESFLRERLFRPFATTKRQGLGLGLYQCRSIVKAHGAHLRVESAPGLGATFRFMLDAAEHHPPELETIPVDILKEKVPS